jgi:hypothetical protein
MHQQQSIVLGIIDDQNVQTGSRGHVFLLGRGLLIEPPRRQERQENIFEPPRRQGRQENRLSQGVSTLAVMPAQAGIHVATPMDSGIRRNDETGL